MTPFGLCNAPATVQRSMDAVLAGLQRSNCLVYLDDVVIPGRSFEEHLCNLSKVFERLCNAGLKLHPSKCSFCCKQVYFLGYIVSQDGVATDPAKTSRVANWLEPTSTSKVRQFLRLASYYRQFVKNFATLAKSLHKLTEKNKEFKWILDCQTAFATLCRLLISTPVLAYPDYNKPFILDTDASDIEVGAVLSQADDSGREHVLVYASWVLTKSERRYCVTRRELLTVVTFVKQVHPYLLRKHFTLRTDHGSLTWLCNFKEPEGQLTRWLEQLQKYDYTIVHKPGRKDGNTDALSRMPCKQCGRVTLEETEQEILIIGLQTSTEQLRDSQLADPIIGPIFPAVEKKDRPSPDISRSQPPMMRCLFQQWDQLKIKESTLWRLFESEDDTSHHIQLIVPTPLREDILQELHAGVSGAHLGQEKTMTRLHEHFYWLGQWRDVSNWCRTCSTRATRKTPVPKARAPLGNIQAGYLMQILAVDILGPLPRSEAGNSYIR